MAAHLVASLRDSQIICQARNAAFSVSSFDYASSPQIPYESKNCALDYSQRQLFLSLNDIVSPVTICNWDPMTTCHKDMFVEFFGFPPLALSQRVEQGVPIIFEADIAPYTRPVNIGISK